LAYLALLDWVPSEGIDKVISLYFGGRRSFGAGAQGDFQQNPDDLSK
jgi:hypothetical protein